MSDLKVGDKAPDFSIATDRGDTFRLSAHKGKPVVITFYPEDNSEGCTIQNAEMTALLPEFEKRGAIVLAISPDSVESHCKFRDKHGFGHLLGSDTGLKVLNAYGLWAQKKLWGHEYMGVLRTTMVVDAKGNIAAILKATRIKGHAHKVLDAVAKL